MSYANEAYKYDNMLPDDSPCDDCEEETCDTEGFCYKFNEIEPEEHERPFVEPIPGEW